ncbi:MAG: AAA family ATPase, partial [Acidimicrobiales bacterium]
MLASVVAQARQGVGGAVVVEGEAGIGKTRLVTELLAATGEEGLRVLCGACDEAEGERPFGALVEALGLGPSAGDDERARLGRLITGEADAGRSLASGSAVGDLGFAIVQSIVGLVEQMAAAGPVLVVLEDLHWADPATLRALRALARAAAGLPLALVVTARPFPRSADLGRAVDDLVSRGAARVDLEPLGHADAIVLATAATGQPRAELARRLVSAGGNPLLLLELVASAGDGNEQPGATGAAVADSLQRTVLRRLRSLPGPTVDALKVAAVLGRRFRLDQLAAVTARMPAELVPVLEDALAAGVLGEEGGELVFRHELIRDAIYTDLALPLRQGLHREAARVLRAGGYPSLQIAEHLVAGAGPGDAEAVRWLGEAAVAAAPRSPQTAVRLLEHAIGLVGAGSSQADVLVAELAPLLVQVGRAGEAERQSRATLARGPVPAVEAALRRGLGEVLWTKGMLEPAVGELEAAARVPGVA